MAPSAATLLVANPAARTGDAADAIAQAMEALSEQGLAPELAATAPHSDAVERIAERIARGDVSQVVYLGGDGTFADAAKSIIRARDDAGIDVPLGMMPMGTANNQGLSFGIAAGSRALAANAAVIAKGRQRPLDVGEIHAFDVHGELLREDLWFDSCGFGLSPRILASRNRDLRWVEQKPLMRQVYRGHAVYMRAWASQFVGTYVAGWRFSGRVVVDGEAREYDEITDLIVMGTVLYGGEWVLAPQARPDDGKFEVIVVRNHADWVSAGLRGLKHSPLPDDPWQALGWAERDFPAGAEIEIELEPRRDDASASIPAQIDGEEFPAARRYRLRNRPRHLNIIVPEDESWI